MSLELKVADGQLKMTNVGVTNSICSSSEGCGGGIYFASATDNNDRYSFSEISVGGNRAHQGRDMFIVVNDLRNSFFGADKENITKGISLDKLLFEHTDTSVVVSSSGRDIHGCGLEREPCQSFFEGMRHFREKIQFREIKINTSAAISDEWDLSNSSISPAVPTSPGYSSSSSSDEPSSDECSINVGKAIQSLSEPSEAVLTNKLMLTFTSINFCLPSSFETQQKELLFTETGTATLNKCSFVTQTAEEGIAFVLFHVSSGTLSIERVYVRMKEKADGLADSWSNEGSVLANLSSFVTCACSTSKGRGGAIALNCLDDPEDSDAPSSEKAKALPIKFRLIRFSLNRASLEKYLFIICRSITSQFNEALFVINFNELTFERDIAIYVEDKRKSEPIDLGAVDSVT
ncbi:uncharacterized protein MONOS_5392 [Monocercomonoides exilis]|uniref:uncharacterized protein n=1 Tax=Monocercomonoides exilis TaxID=2049356 RepID=UPI00355AC590|nr:hypothetical protein MONOS_5392 [Monocercomonoides exilis]|eukprot:MONOS_5392.1-p1 / transcript=MONOS_5392.1 / gene=MONOS_5392 / organism=Monocercomonoides_exilis_PA203 / gene_product=unspecified product / transcript_product=unspecified product / location=Mono_scaffold00156:27458-28896(+) / protein_length=405 / sequence_SO=supercontig / SO=protein_coding / is_pseudo=false